MLSLLLFSISILLCGYSDRSTCVFEAQEQLRKVFDHLVKIHNNNTSSYLIFFVSRICLILEISVRALRVAGHEVEYKITMLDMISQNSGHN